MPLFIHVLWLVSHSHSITFFSDLFFFPLSVVWKLGLIFVKFLVHALTSLQAVSSLPLHHVSSILLISRRDLLEFNIPLFPASFLSPFPEGFFRDFLVLFLWELLNESLQQRVVWKLAYELNRGSPCRPVLEMKGLVLFAFKFPAALKHSGVSQNSNTCNMLLPQKGE